jgi:hypothetical protein
MATRFAAGEFAPSLVTHAPPATGGGPERSGSDGKRDNGAPALGAREGEFTGELGGRNKGPTVGTRFRRFHEATRP